jgi:chromosome segregation ATPase
MYNFNKILYYLLGLHFIMWADDENNSGSDANEPEVKEETKEHEGLTHLSEEDKNKILRLRRESADRRTQIKELKEELNTIKTKTQKQEEDKLIEDGKLKELLDEKQKQLDELSGIKDENDKLKTHFEKQLEAATNKLSKEQQELINDSGWDVAKKLEWALRFSDKTLSKNDSPDAKRPGGEQPESVDLSEYKGPEGRKKLAMLKFTNPAKYKLVMDLRKK